jgi:hypothetical protein
MRVSVSYDGFARVQITSFVCGERYPRTGCAGLMPSFKQPQPLVWYAKRSPITSSVYYSYSRQGIQALSNYNHLPEATAR